MADFSKSEAGAYFIALCYKYAVATCIFLFLLFVSLLSFNSFHCCFHLKFYITFLHCVRVTTLPLVRRRILFQRPLSVPLERCNFGIQLKLYSFVYFSRVIANDILQVSNKFFLPGLGGAESIYCYNI